MNSQTLEPPGENSPDFARYGVATSDLAHVIIEFAKPMLQYCDSYASREEAISYAILAWNLSLEKPAEQERLRLEVESQVPGENREQIHALFDFLLSRKQEFYADNRFYILEYTLNRKGDGMRIEMSTRFIPRS
jgi:hypothetical protein